MSPALPLVLKLPRHEHDKEEADFVLVHVASDGRHPLDLKLIGTENSAVFALELKHAQASALKTRNASCNTEEWEKILSTVLCGQEGNGDLIKGVEAIAKVDSKAITITVQKRIEGITQKLGILTLPSNDDAEVDLYEWLGLTIQSRDASKHDVDTLQTEVEEKDARIKHLDDALAELVKLKSEHENDLLEKFSFLLNEKKLKIRNQQRLLASADVDPAKLEAVEQTRTSRSAGPSRPGKRKADKTKGAQLTDSDSNSGFEKMDVDPKDDALEAANESEQEQPQTPEDSTADEATENEDEPLIPPPNRKTTKAAVAKGKQKSVMPATGTGEGKVTAILEDDDKPPPKRELPFKSKKATTTAAKTAPVAKAVEGSETESDDDELY